MGLRWGNVYGPGVSISRVAFGVGPGDTLQRFESFYLLIVTV